jgi:hypothetical protein
MKINKQIKKSLIGHNSITALRVVEIEMFNFENERSFGK